MASTSIGTRVVSGSDSPAVSRAPEFPSDLQPVLAAHDDLLRARRSFFVWADLIVIWCAALLALPLRFTFSIFRHPFSFPPTATGHLAFLLLYSGLIVLFSNTQRLYSSYYFSSRRETLAVIKAVFLASVLLTGCIYLSGRCRLNLAAVSLA